MGSADRITSTKNPLVRRFRAAALGEQAGVLVADGFRLAQEALAAGLAPVEFAWSDKLLQRDGGKALLARLQRTPATEHSCSDQVVERLSHLKTHQGVVVMVRQPQVRLEDLAQGETETPLVVVAAGVQDPGNLGALIRCAEAAGASGFLALAGGADPYRDKAVRGSMGSVFRLPCVANVSIEAAVAFLQETGLQVVVADQGAAAGKSFWDAELTGPTALVLGSEGGGVPAALSKIAAVTVRIPITDPVDSLNVAVAAGVLLFEARRQRQLKSS